MYPSPPPPSSSSRFHPSPPPPLWRRLCLPAFGGWWRKIKKKGKRRRRYISIAHSLLHLAGYPPPSSSFFIPDPSSICHLLALPQTPVISVSFFLFTEFGKIWWKFFSDELIFRSLLFLLRGPLLLSPQIREILGSQDPVIDFTPSRFFSISFSMMEIRFIPSPISVTGLIWIT